MRIFRADLHIHTCLSPCGELEMSPKAIVNEAVSKGIELIAICDHNSAENVTAVMEASHQTSVTVLPGIEVTSKEEVHISGLFNHPDDASSMQLLVYNHLDGKNDETAFGLQVVVDKDGTVMDYNDKLLIGATNLSLENIVQAIHDRRGLAIASHIDREGFGILGQLGFIPADLELDALEVSSKVTLNETQTIFKEYRNYPFLRSSDAHRLSEIGRGRTPLMMAAVSFEELKMVLKGEQGRTICYEEQGI